jgi:AraC-like DNA-binding protein
MSETTLNNAETTDTIGCADTLSDVMSSMRISGSVLLNEDYAPSWGVTIPGAERLRTVMKLGSGVRVVAFHFVKRGYIELTPDGEDSITVESGEMAICFGGLPHRVSQGMGKKVVSAESLLTGGKNPFQPDAGSKARSTSLMCGVFMMRNVELNPLFSSLPPVLHVSAQRPGRLHNLPDVLNWTIQEAAQITPGSIYVIERLLELLCAEVLRAHLENSATASGWFSGLKDPVVGRAISMIHSRPGELWTVNRLAQGVAMSPSRFAARFSAALGESPMAYVTKWRMNVAGRLLGESRQGVGEIAADLGYENVAAFGRAFKRHLGVPPATWRSCQSQ